MGSRSLMKRQAARYWWHRERVEVQAAAVFSELERALEGPLSTAAHEARDDELRHADQCRALVERFDPGVHSPVGRTLRRTPMGPAGLRGRARGGLYAAVAVGCVTESLSVALLMEIRRTATDALVQETAQAILKDEVRHSRLGWGALAAAQTGGDISWLEPHLPAMISAALEEETATPQDEDRLPSGSLEAYGILSPESVRRVGVETLEKVIRPGFAHFLLKV